jgi:hypothetical protein
LLGVHEGITALQYTNRINCSSLTYSEFYNEYFEAKDKRFTPFQSTFKADCYSDLITLSYIQLTEKSPKFSYKFWFDFIENHSPNIVTCAPNVRQKNLMFGGAFFMAKHSVEVKLNSVLYYLNNNTSLREACYIDILEGNDATEHQPK